MTVKLRRTRTVAASVRTLLFRSFLMFLSAITIRPACASTLDDFTVAVEAAMADGRVASSYLRTGNLDLAGVEIDRMRKAWAAVVDKFVKDRPNAFKDANQFNVTMTNVSAAYDKLDVDVNDMTVRDDIQKQADAYATLMKTCDGLASSKIHDDPQFRRLIDGADASLKNIKRALDERDAGLLHRVFDELRAIDNLLAFSVG
jgi:hypothetical protein